MANRSGELRHEEFSHCCVHEGVGREIYYIFIIIASFWVLCLVASLCTIFDQRITALYALILVPLSLLISLASYTKIFRTSLCWMSVVQDSGAFVVTQGTQATSQAMY